MAALTSRHTQTACIDRLEVDAYTIPTETPESDGTLEWDSTTIVVVHAWSGEQWGMGYTYADPAAAELIRQKLAGSVIGQHAMAVPGTWASMVRTVRNLGWPGMSAMAIAAVDCALWDLKARLLDLPLVALLGQIHDGLAVYGSGGFTSYDERQLAAQLGGWVEQGIERVKMKVGRDIHADPHRVAIARQAIGDSPQLFVDANGAYTLQQALAMAKQFGEQAGVTWFEEPRPSDDLDGLRLIRQQRPLGMSIAAGEYGYHMPYFKHMLDAEAVDCLQADVTRCSGITGFMKVAALCDTACMALSAHCAPAEHLHVCCAAGPVCHLEYFFDHVRIEHMLFDGISDPRQGTLYPDLSRPGMGLVLKQDDAAPYRV